MNKNSLLQLVFGLSAAVLTVVLIALAVRIDEGGAEDMRPFVTGWTAGDGAEYDISQLRVDESGISPLLEKKLPEDIRDDDHLCFESSNVNVYVLVEGHEIYSFESKENITGSGYGTAYHEVGLAKDHAGKTVELYFSNCNPKYPSKRGYITNMYVGPVVSYIHMELRSNAPALLASGLILFFGIVFLLISLVVSDRERMPFDVTYLGMASVLIGAWLIVLTNVYQLVTDHIYVVRVLNRFLILLAGAPLVGFFNSLTRKKRRIYTLAAFGSSVLLIALLLILRFAAGVDMMQSFQKILMIFYAVVIITTLVMFVDNERFCHRNGIASGMKFYYAAIAVFVVCALADYALYSTKRLFGITYGALTSIGTFILVPVALVQFIRWWTKDREVIERERFTNRALQYALSSDSPDESIRLMLEYMGKELKCKRAIVFEDMHNGRFAGKYGWFDQSLGSRSIDLLYLPYKGFVEEVLSSYTENGNSFLIADLEAYRDVDQNIYNLLRSYSASSVIVNPLEVDGDVTGLLVLLDLPADLIEEASSVSALTSYFLSQLILRRDDQKRMRTYTYNDSLSGAGNRRAYEEFVKNGLDMASPFGYVSCEICDLDKISEEESLEAGDKKVIDTVEMLSDIFGKENVYRMVGSRFAAFGFETDETYFRDDVAKFEKKAAEAGISVNVGYVYCQNGTTDMQRVIRTAGERIKGGKQ